MTDLGKKEPDLEDLGAGLREPDGGPPRLGTVLWLRFIQPAGISKGAFARHTGIPPDEFSRILHGGRKLSLDRAQCIASATGTLTLQWLKVRDDRQAWEADQHNKLTIKTMNAFQRMQARPGPADSSMPQRGDASRPKRRGWKNGPNAGSAGSGGEPSGPQHGPA